MSSNNHVYNIDIIPDTLGVVYLAQNNRVAVAEAARGFRTEQTLKTEYLFINIKTSIVID